MAKNTIITIGRQFGSGGHEVGKRLSDRLGIPFYDRGLIRMAAEELGVSPKQAEEADETILGKFLSAYVVGVGDYTMYMKDQEEEKPLSDKVFQAESQLIRRCAQKGPCIIVGRCADYILDNDYQCINAFIYAEISDRIQRVMKSCNLEEEDAWEKIKAVDAQRKLYYEAHTGNTWGSIESHQLMFNISLLNIADVVDILAAMHRSKR